MVIQTRTVVIALALGIIVTLLASLSPARRATQIAPVAALQEGATLPPRLSARRPAVPITILVVAAVLCLAGAAGVGSLGLSMILVGLGAVALFLGVIMIAGRLVGPLAAVVGAPARRFGGPAGRLASGNATRNTTRTATTAARPHDRARARHAVRHAVQRLRRRHATGRRGQRHRRLRRDLQGRLRPDPGRGRGGRRARSRGQERLRHAPRRGEGVRRGDRRRRHRSHVRTVRRPELQAGLGRGHPAPRRSGAIVAEAVRRRPRPADRQRVNADHFGRPAVRGARSPRSSTRRPSSPATSPSRRRRSTPTSRGPAISSCSSHTPTARTRRPPRRSTASSDASRGRRPHEGGLGRLPRRGHAHSS